jgi:hypothetical protein
VTGGGGCESELNQILLQEPAYVPSSNPKAKTQQEGDEHTNQRHRDDPSKLQMQWKKNEINWTPD